MWASLRSSCKKKKKHQPSKWCEKVQVKEWDKVLTSERFASWNCWSSELQPEHLISHHICPAFIPHLLEALLGYDAVVLGQPQDGVIRFSLQDTSKCLQGKTLYQTLTQQEGAVHSGWPLNGTIVLKFQIHSPSCGWHHRWRKSWTDRWSAQSPCPPVEGKATD